MLQPVEGASQQRDYWRNLRYLSSSNDEKQCIENFRVRRNILTTS